jgi:hypothetical protein
MIGLLFVFCVLVFGTSAVSALEDSKRDKGLDILSWVDPLIGSESGGNVFAGATLPYGMAKGSHPTIQLIIVQS